MKKIDFRKGSASFFEFAVCGTFLIYILILIVGFFIRDYTIQLCDKYIDEISRAAVTCSDETELATLLQSKAYTFTELEYVDKADIEADYLPGAGGQWKKGNFIQIDFAITIDSIQFWKKKVYNRTVIKMIENSGDDKEDEED